MSPQTSVQRLQKAPDVEIPESHLEPGAGDGPHAREVAIAARKRLQLGLFIRKIVDGEVVREWQFPPVKWRAVRKIDGHVPEPDEPEECEPGYGEEGDLFQGQTFALSSTGGGESNLDTGIEASSVPDDGGNTGPIHETRYEVGAFFGTVTVETDSDSNDS